MDQKVEIDIENISELNDQLLKVQEINMVGHRLYIVNMISISLSRLIQRDRSRRFCFLKSRNKIMNKLFLIFFFCLGDLHDIVFNDHFIAKIIDFITGNEE